MNQGHGLTLRRFAGPEIPMAFTLMAGIMIGIIILKSWILALALSLLVVISGVAVYSVFLIWLALITNLFFVSNYFGPPLSTVFFWGLLALFILSVWGHKRVAGSPLILGNRLFWLAFLSWYSWGVMAAVFSPDALFSIREMLRYGVLILTLFSFVQWVSNENALRHILQTLWVVFLVYAVLMITKIMSEGSSISSWLGNAWHSHAESGSLFAAFIPIFGSLLRYQRGPSVVHGLGILLLFIAVYFSDSASALLTAGVGILVLIGLNLPSYARRIMGWVALASLGLLFLAFLYMHGFNEKMIYQLSGRDRVWSAAGQAILTHPFWGIGPGQWQTWLSAHYVTADFILDDMQGNTFFLNPSTLKGQAHNLFLTKAAEMGVPSFIFLVGILGSWLFKAVSIYRLPLEGWRRHVMQGCLASFVGLIFFCLFENGPIIGVAREGEVLLITLILAIPFGVEYWHKKSPLGELAL